MTLFAAGMTKRPSAGATLMTFGLLSWIVACQTLVRSNHPTAASLRTDSAEVGVRFNGKAYSAKIGFVYVNNTDKPVSKAGCGGPRYPELEKNVGGRWVPAYEPVYLLCLTIPDFTVGSGESFYGVLDFVAFQPGNNTYPTLVVDSIDGTYRLRWDFSEGAVAHAKGARKVAATSNEFQMVLR